MSCSDCIRKNPCGCEKKKSCDDCPVVDWVPNTACTIGITVNGCTDTLELKQGIQNCETKTHMTQNQKTGCIEYQNELYVSSDGQDGYLESICPIDIAKFINLEDLANVEDAAPDHCSLLVYHADSNCGPGCQGISDSWVHWYASENLTSGLHFVAGFNSEGCLQALDVPATTDEYWWGMWRPTDSSDPEFGYVQPEEVADLPTDENGDPIVLSQDENGKPVVGSIPLNCILNNIMTNLGSDIFGTFRIIQNTPNFTSTFNNHTGDFTITWNDWNYSGGQVVSHTGTGVISGKMSFNFQFDLSTGNYTYNVTNLRFSKVVWTKDVGFLQGETPAFTLKGKALGTGTEVMLVDRYVYDGSQNWTININRDIACSLSATVAPGQTTGPFDYAYMKADWVYDDEGYTQVNFKNLLEGWTGC